MDNIDDTMEETHSVAQLPTIGESSSSAGNAPMIQSSTEIVHADVLPRKQRRERLLRGLHGLSSSSPSLSNITHSRSLSSPYHGAPTFSCVSLSSTTSPFATTTSPFFVSPSGLSTAPTSQPGTPGTLHIDSYFDAIEVPARKAEAGGLSSTATTPLPIAVKSKKRIFNIWAHLPHELKVHTLSFLQPKELVRISRTSQDFHMLCFDGQLWTSLDASEFYREIPAASLAKIIVSAGPFVKDLNLRGCVQVEHYKRAEIIVNACKNLINATLEGCRNLQRTTLHSLLTSNGRLAYLNLTGLTAVTDATCKVIAQHCQSLEVFNVSWCKHMTAHGVLYVVQACPRLKDLRAGEIKGFDNGAVAEAIFRTNRLEKLVLAGCSDLTDASLARMMRGVDPEIDILTNKPKVAARRLRYVDLARCTRLTHAGVSAMGHVLPHLEGLSLSGCTALTDAGLEPIFASSPLLTHLDLEDVPQLTNAVLANHLATSRCVRRLQHLCISHCETLGDAGMVPVIQRAVNLTSLQVDNTNISDLALSEATLMMRARARYSSPSPGTTPVIGLHMVAYDCAHVTWAGIRHVLHTNAILPSISPPSTSTEPSSLSAEIIGLKCYYGWQMTVDEHTKRVLKGDLASAKRLEKKWAEYMQANHEAEAQGAGVRRRRRRAREAQIVHADEADGAVGSVAGRRRARSLGSCAVM